MGQGRGHGEDSATNVVAGSGVAVCVAVCFFCFGLPAITVGAVLMAFMEGTAYTVGLVLIVLSGFFVVVGVILVIAICAGCCGKNQLQNQGVMVQGGHTVVTTSTGPAQPLAPEYGYGVQNPTLYGQNPPGYGQNPPGYGQNPPGYGQNPPGYGQNPPGYEHNPPPFGKNLPDYGQNQTTNKVEGV